MENDCLREVGRSLLPVVSDEGQECPLYEERPVAMVFGRIPSEISFEWVYFPPFFFTVVLGFVVALCITRLLNATGLSRFFWYPNLAFVSFWVLATSLTGLLFIPP